MNRSMFEALESRQMLSVAAPFAAEVPAPAMASALHAHPTAAAVTLYGSYVGTVTVEGADVSGRIVVQILKRAGTQTIGRIYSADFGGFDVPLTGTATTAAFSLAGRSDTAVVKRIRGTLSTDRKSISGSITLVQNGLPIAVKFSLARTAKAPKPVAAKAPNIVGNYRGTSISASGKREAISFQITGQSGGLIWGKDGGGIATGVVLADGSIYIHVREAEGGTDEIEGRFQAGKITGQWEWSHGKQSEHGTFTLSRA